MPLISSLGVMNAIGFGFSNLTPSYLLVSGGSTPYVAAYKFDYTNGFSTKYNNPSTIPTSQSYSIRSNKRGDNVLFNSTSTPYIFAYKWTANGFGTKYNNPASLPTRGEGAIIFDPAENYVVAPGDGTAYITAYNWSSIGFGTRLANPAKSLGFTMYGAAFNPTGTALAVTNNSGGTGLPHITVYAWSNGFGTAYTNPGTISTGNEIGTGVTFDKTGGTLAFNDGAFSINAYAWSSGFGTKYANAGTGLTGTGQGVCFNNNNTVVSAMSTLTPFISSYPWSSGFGTKYTAPANVYTLTGTGSYSNVSYNKVGNVIARGTSNYAAAYKWTNVGGYGTAYTQPTDAIGTIRSVTFIN